MACWFRSMLLQRSNRHCSFFQCRLWRTKHASVVHISVTPQLTALQNGEVSAVSRRTSCEVFLSSRLGHFNRIGNLNRLSSYRSYRSPNMGKKSKAAGAAAAGGDGGAAAAAKPPAKPRAPVDPRFAALQTDSRFERFPAPRKAVTIDDRFAGAPSTCQNVARRDMLVL